MQLKWPMLWDLFLFPAHAGVIPDGSARFSLQASFPRTRGGDPGKYVVLKNGAPFSPHTRG